jgi:hypothetical protein
MTKRIPVRCRCGAVRGFLADIQPKDGKRAICYCDDCQIYAMHLGGSDLLDERGGTEAVMSTPAQLTFTEGASQVRCLRLSPKGLYRWYAGCCKTPLGNMISPAVPVLIVATVSLDVAAAGQSLDEALGPPVVRMQARYAKGGAAQGAHAKTPLRMLPNLVSHLLRAYLKRRGRPSPFFDAHDEPNAAPQVIDKAERESLRARVLAAAQA